MMNVVFIPTNFGIEMLEKLCSSKNELSFLGKENDLQSRTNSLEGSAKRSR